MIDGNGATWWERKQNRKLKYGRPSLMEFMYSENIHVHHLTLKNSAFWTLRKSS